MVKNVFWGFVYAEKLDQENKEQDLARTESIGILQDRKIFFSIYRMDSSAPLSKSCMEKN